MRFCTCGHTEGVHTLGPECNVLGCKCVAFEAIATPIDGVCLEPTDGTSLAVARHLESAFKLYMARKGERGDGWKRAGVKSMCHEMLTKAERAFYQAMAGQTPNPDHFIDMINYAAFALYMGSDMNGSRPWPEVVDAQT